MKNSNQKNHEQNCNQKQKSDSNPKFEINILRLSFRNDRIDFLLIANPQTLKRDRSLPPAEIAFAVTPMSHLTIRPFPAMDLCAGMADLGFGS
jgi:hypothetical protein